MPIPDPKQRYWLLCDLAKSGFCLPPEANRRLLEDPPESVDDYTDFVMTAEGLDPAFYRGFRDGVRKVVARHYGEPQEDTGRPPMRRPRRPATRRWRR